MKLIKTSGKRKKAIARATLREGSGIVRINKVPLDVYAPVTYRLKIREPILLARDVAEKIDVDIHVEGGGSSSQADASRLALAKGMVEFSKSDKVKEAFLEYDRNLLIGDVRFKEPAKPNRHGQARAKRQKSYR